MSPSAMNKPPARRPFLLIVPALVAGALLALGIIPRLHASAQAKAEAQTAMAVNVIQPGRAPATQDLVLPGQAMPYAEADLHARVSGYVAHWSADIGSHVASGAVLATIAAPEVDAQLAQAKADAATAQANAGLADLTAARWEKLVRSESVSQQAADQKNSDQKAKQAMLASAQANANRLGQLQSFEKIVAPFAGLVTARAVDVGTLVTADGGNALFHLAETDKLRVFVDVPEENAPAIGGNTAVYLQTQAYPDRRFTGTVARTAGAIDPVSHTLRVEGDVDNADGALLPGAFVQVHLAIKASGPGIELPVSALLFRPAGPTAAVVGDDGKVVLKTVRIGRDFGTSVEVVTGLVGNERVIANPGDSLYPGQEVRVVPAASSRP
ncbi:MAG: efflux RND transporter periplasmic adaptor subunit [Azospirillaceae bacterium]|nr:efflux RND transporter periplasmic adaptor subunit [Azospirillaceae bacterium]